MARTNITNFTHEEWLAERRNGIGGSDAAAILGLNPYFSAFALYCDKTGIRPEQPDNEAMRQGRDLEQYVADRFEEATGKKTRKCNFLITNDENPFMVANIDRMVDGEDAGLECKTTSVYNKTDFEGGDVPPNYYVQCVHYMAVTGKSKWYLAVLVLNKGFYWFEIQRNEEEIAALIKAEKEFWEEHVLKNIPPAPSGTEKDGDLVRTITGAASERTVSLSPDFAKKLDKYDELNQTKKLLDEQIEQIKQEIQLAMMDASVAVCGDRTVTWKEYSRTSVNGKRLQADYPDVYEKMASTTTYRKFDIKGVKEK